MLNLEIFSKDFIHFNSQDLKPAGIVDLTASTATSTIAYFSSILHNHAATTTLTIAQIG